MKRVITIYLSLFIASFCFAQNNWRVTIDSLALESRSKADLILAAFDSLPGKKILFSLQNRDYHLIIQLNNGYKEYIVKTDNFCNIITFLEIENEKTIETLKKKRILSRKNRRKLKQLQDSIQMLSDAFDINQYNTDFTTSVPNATYIGGVSSYFVLKDEKNNRYGEYCLSSLTAPCPINPSLWLYLINAIMDNSLTHDRSNYLHFVDKQTP